MYTALIPIHSSPSFYIPNPTYIYTPCQVERILLEISTQALASVSGGSMRHAAVPSRAGAGAAGVGAGAAGVGAEGAGAVAEEEDEEMRALHARLQNL